MTMEQVTWAVEVVGKDAWWRIHELAAKAGKDTFKPGPWAGS